jgi:hypothetical protein
MNRLNPLIFSCIVLSSVPVRALENWNMTYDTHSFVYTPNDLTNGNRFQYAVYGPFELNGSKLKDWFKNKSKGLQSCLGRPLKEWYLIRERKGWSVSNLFDDAQGREMSVAYYGGELSNNRAYIIRMLADDDFMVLLKYGADFHSVLNDAKKVLEKKTTIKSHELVFDGSEQQVSAIAGCESVDNSRKKDSESGVSLSELEAVWVDSGVDMIWGGVDVDTYLMFKDGSAYKNCVVAPSELNLQKSKILEPEKWTTWRKHKGIYQIKFTEIDGWKSLVGTHGIAANPKQSIEGKYVNSGGSQFRGFWKKSITFFSNGRFETSATSMRTGTPWSGNDISPLESIISAIDDDAAYGTATVIGNRLSDINRICQKNKETYSGSYQLDKYAITLIHDSGKKHKELFYFEEKDGMRNIVYGSDVYWLEN